MVLIAKGDRERKGAVRERKRERERFRFILKRKERGTERSKEN